MLAAARCGEAAQAAAGAPAARVCCPEPRPAPPASRLPPCPTLCCPQWLPEKYSPIYNDFAWDATILCPDDMKITLDFPE